MVKDSIVFNAIISEVERFKSVAEALSNEECRGEFIVHILIKHLTVKFNKLED